MKLRWNLLPVVVILAILVMVVACKKDDDEEEPPPPPPVNNPVLAFVLDPVGVQTNEVALTYSLVDGDADFCSIVVRYSTNGGSSFSTFPATEFVGPGTGSEGVFNLTSGPFPGVLHTFVWDTIADLGPIFGNNIMLRVTPSDADLGVAATTGAFSVDNRIKPPPAATIQTIPDPPPQSGDVIVNYTLFDVQSFPAAITVEYSTNGGAQYLPASEVVGPPSEGMTGLTTAPPPPSGVGVPHVFVWDSMADGVGLSFQQTAVIRITPQDASQIGSPGISNFFGVDNQTNTAPAASATTPVPGPPPTGNLTISYTLTDLESDRLDLTVEYSTNGGASYAPASKGPGGDPVTNVSSSPGGDAHTFVWNTLANVGATLQGACRIRITPSDGDPTASPVAGETTDFQVDNRDTTPPEVFTITDAATNTSDQRIVIDFNESLDTASVIVGAAPPATFAVFEDDDTIPGGTYSYFPGSVVFQTQARRLVFFPDRAFTENREIRTVLSSGITDVGGNGLFQDPVSPFVPSDPLSFTGTFPLQVFENRFLPGGIPECARFLPDPNSDIWHYDFETFGTFDSDLQNRGLRGSDPGVNALARDRVMATVLGWMSDKYGRDFLTGAAQPGAYKVSFVCTPPPGGVLEVDYSRMCVGLDKSGSGVLGTAWLDPNNRWKEDDCSSTVPLGVFAGGINGTNSTLSPPLDASDLPYVDGSYSLGSGSPSEDARFRDVDAVINDWAHALATVGAHETGHSVGLQHDDGNSLNIMRAAASSSFLSNTDNRFSSGSRAVLDVNLGIVP